MKKSVTIFPFDGIKFVRMPQNSEKSPNFFWNCLVTSERSRRFFFQNLWPSQNVWTLTAKENWEMFSKFCGLVKKYPGLFYTLNVFFFLFSATQTKIGGCQQKARSFIWQIKGGLGKLFRFLFTMHFFIIMFEMIYLIKMGLNFVCLQLFLFKR